MEVREARSFFGRVGVREIVPDTFFSSLTISECVCHNSGMQNIQLPDDQYQKLTVVAQAAGYEDVPAFISALANEPTEDPRRPLSEKELRESVAMIERGNVEIAAGGGMDAEEAFGKIAKKHGFSITQ